MTGPASPGTIVRVSWRSFRVPFASAFQTSRAALAVREGLMVTVETDAGARGIGEASPLPEFDGGTMAGTAAALEAMARRIAGLGLAEAWEEPHAELNAEAGSARVARAGLESAIADAMARAAGLPLWAWLERRTAATADADPLVPVNATVDAPEPEGVAKEVARAAAAGFAAIKLKVGSDAVRDLARIAAARAAGGPAIELRIDANGGWDDARAEAALLACEPYHVALCEQPLDPRRPDCIEATARLRVKVPVPVALDESCRTVGDIRRIREVGAADAVVLKPMLTGLREALAMLSEASRGDLGTIVTTTFDAGVGTAMAIHLAALIPPPRPACGLATLDRLEHALSLAGTTPVAGTIRACGPGLGVSLEEAALARYAGPISGTVAR